MTRLTFAQRLVLNCVGCGFEAASVAVGTDPETPDETYGSRCWVKPWVGPRPAHTHLDGHDCGPECED